MYGKFCRTCTTTKTQQKGKTLVLRLREPPTNKPKVTWSEDTVNNEGLGRKSSKRKFNLILFLFLFLFFFFF